MEFILNIKFVTEVLSITEIMLGHHIVWYVHSYECFGVAFYTDHQMMEVVGPGQILCADHSDHTVL